jgi:hypothetical protein
MDKYLVTERSENRFTGPILVTTSPRLTCPQICAFRKHGNGPLAGLCYAEHGAIGGFVWSSLDRSPVGASILNGTRVYGFDELLYIIRSLPPGTLWRHNVAGDLTSNDQRTVDATAIRLLTEANRNRRGFTFTHYDTLNNETNREAIRHANANGFRINLSGNSPEHADQLADLGIAPVTVILPTDWSSNTTTPKGRSVVVCPNNTSPGVTCATCQLCSRMRSTIVGFPAIGGLKSLVTRNQP